MMVSYRFLVAALAITMIGFAGTASANLLVNPGFEDPNTPDPPPEFFGAGAGWTSFGGGIFTINNAGAGSSIAANGGDQSLKLFGGCCSGAFQQFPAVPGQLWNGGAWVANQSSDPLGGGQVAAVNIEWIQADGTTNSVITPFISNGTFTAASPTDTWTLQTITGTAPADAAFARLTLITGDFLDGGPGGAPLYDDAFFEVIPEPTTISLAGLALCGLLGRFRRLK